MSNFKVLTFVHALFDNVFTCCWFVLVTMTTVGYGDIYPKSSLGKAVDAAAILAGTLCMAMPITIIGSAFTDVWEERAKASAAREATGGAHRGGDRFCR